MVKNLANDRSGCGRAVICDRRAVLTGSMAASALVLVELGAATGQDCGAAGGHLAFFNDRPMHDPSGTLPPYGPPAGHRGAGSFAALDDERLRYLMPFMT
jgi:hypothetical protein